MFAALLALAACHSPGKDGAPSDVDVTLPTLTLARPTRAPADVLLARLDAKGRVTVEGSVVADAWVDIDEGEDDRYGFRYVIDAADGTTLYTRSTSGPVIVKDFLDYYGEMSGFDILGSLPLLGTFTTLIPRLDGAATVRFQWRTAEGYVDIGSYDLANLTADDRGLSTAVTGWETLHDAGPSENRLDLVLVGDGYTADEQAQWERDAQAVADEILATPPYAELADYINIHRVDAVSAESGASYDCVGGCGMRDTAFDSFFAMEAVNDILGTSYRTAPIFQLDQYAVAQAASVVPWDLVEVVVNTPHDGGMTVHYATVPTGNQAFERVAVHELSHLWGQLGDEYAEDYCIRSTALGLPANIAEDPENPPWAAWIADDTPLPTPSTSAYADTVGAFAPAYNCDDLYRAEERCLMKDHNDPPCVACAEALARRTLRFADPIDDITVTQDGADAVLTAVGPRSDVGMAWSLDGVDLGEGTTLRVPIADLSRASRLTATATLSSPSVRVDGGDLSETWALDVAP